MSFTHRLTVQFQDGLSSIGSPTAITADAQIEMDLLLPAPTVSKQVNIAFPFAQLTSFYIVSDQTITLFTNSTTGAGGNTLTLTAGVPVFFQVQATAPAFTVGANPFTVDVTKFYLNNATAFSANVNIRILMEGAP